MSDSSSQFYDDTITGAKHKQIKIFPKQAGMEDYINKWIIDNDLHEVEIIPQFDGGIILSYTKMRKDLVKIIQKYRSPEIEESNE